MDVANKVVNVDSGRFSGFFGHISFLSLGFITAPDTIIMDDTRQANNG